MAPAYDALDDDALFAHLSAEANDRGQRLSVEERGGGWRAAFLGRSGFGGDIVSQSAQAADRRTAMMELAILAEHNM